MEEKNLKRIWIISIFIILILFSMYLVFSKDKTIISENNNTNEKYSIVKNYNDFYTDKYNVVSFGIKTIIMKKRFLKI